MQSKTEALMQWLQAVTNIEFSQITQLKDGKILSHLLSKLDGFQLSSQFKQTSDWKHNYNVLKQIYEQLNSSLQKNSKMSLPQQLSYMNLIEVSQGKSEEGLQTLLHLVFIVCIQSSIKSQFIPCIMQLSSQSQKELMEIIQESTIEEQEDERDNLINQYKQNIAKLEFAYNTLVTENQALRASLFEDEERVNKNEQLLKKFQDENEHLNRELFEKNQMLIKSREQLMLDKYGTVNEELVQDLKKELLDREQHYGHQILELNETIATMKEELGQYKKNHLEMMEQKSSRSMMRAREDHTNCIPVDRHKAKINQMLAMSKEVTQKEMAAKLQNIKLKNSYAELESKLKRVSQELYKKNEDFTISKGDSSKLKVEFFTRIRDSLKRKLEESKLQSGQSIQNCSDFLENQA